MTQAHASSSTYRPPRRQEFGGPEPMDLSYVESERPRFLSNKRLLKCNQCQKLGHFVRERSAIHPVPKGTEGNIGPHAKKGNGRESGVVAKSQQRGGPQNMVGISRGANAQLIQHQQENLQIS